MDLDELRGFLAVIETGSMLGAATALGVPRATLRRRIDTLEARTGVPLLDRSARGVTPTDAGTLLAERGRRLLADGAALLAAARAAGHTTTLTLGVRVPVGLPPAAMVTFAWLQESFLPNLRFIVSMCEDPQAGLRGEAELAVHFGPGRQRDGWVVHKLANMPVRLLASPAYLARHGTPRSLAQLDAHTIVSWTGPGLDGRSLPLRAGGTHECRPRFVCNDAHALREQARAGFALALLPDANLDLLGLPSDELQPVLDDQVGCELALNLSLAGLLAERPEVARVVESLTRFARRS